MPLGDPGKPWTGPFRGTDATAKLMRDYARGDEGEKNFRVRQWAEMIVKDVPPKDYLSEILALRAWCVSPWCRYTNDARHVEQCKTPLRMLGEIESAGVTLVDCDDIATLLASFAMCLGRECEFVMAAFERMGQYTHVFVRIKEPRSGSWIICDPVAGTREAEMARSIKRHAVLSVD
jgi:hypothetical protein